VQKIPVTIEAAREAKKAIIPTLDRIFNKCAKSPVNGIGIAKDGEDYCVKVNLTQKPDSGAFILLPRQRNGVKIKYDIPGRVFPG
jgi:hypothetical protein